MGACSSQEAVGVEPVPRPKAGLAPGSKVGSNDFSQHRAPQRFDDIPILATGGGIGKVESAVGHAGPRAHAHASPKVAGPSSLRIAGPASLLRRPAGPSDVRQRGVRLSYLLHLSRTVDSRLTIAEVVEQVIRPRTQDDKCCYWDVIPKQHTGPPAFFISHTWSRQLRDLLTILTAHFGIEYDPEAAEEPYSDEGSSPLVWLDILAINQWPYVDAKGLLVDDVSNLANVIKATDKTLFCLDDKGVVLTRIWCLFEIWHTVLAGGPSKLLILSNQVDGDALKNVYIELDVEQAKATMEEDRVKILAEIKQSMGFHEMNHAIKNGLVGATEFEAHQAQELAIKVADGKAKPPPGKEAWQVIVDATQKVSKHIQLLQMAGRNKETSRYSRILEVLQSRMGKDGRVKADELEAAACQDQVLAQAVAAARKLRGEFQLDAAAAEFESAASRAEGKLKKGWSEGAVGDALVCLHGLLLCRKDQGQLQEALSAVQRAIAALDTDPESPERDAMRSAILLERGALLMSSAKTQEAAADLREALECNRRAKSAGASPDDALPWPAVSEVAVVEKLAGVLVFVGDSDGSVRCWQEAVDLRGQQAAEGSEARRTEWLGTRTSLGTALVQASRLKEAEKVFRGNIRDRLKFGGPHKNAVISDYSQLASVLAKTGRAAEALGLHQKISKIYLAEPTTAETTMELPGKGKMRLADAYADGTMLLMEVPSAAAEVKAALGGGANSGGGGATGKAAGKGGTSSSGGIDDDLASVSDRAYKAWGELKYDEAERLMRRRVELVIASVGEGHSDTIAAQKLLAQLLQSQPGRTGEAEAVLRAALASQRKLHKGLDPDTADTLIQLANTVSSDEGRGPEADALFQEAVDLLTKVLGEGHQRTLTAKIQLCSRELNAACAAADPVLIQAAKERLEAASKAVQSAG